MKILNLLALGVIILFLVLSLVLYFLQTRLIFYPGRLEKDHRFRLRPDDEEVWIKTKDGETIHGLFFKGERPEVVLYFHGNAGDLSGWQFVHEDFTDGGYNILLIDYRGYGKSTGSISEKGFYEDGKAAYYFLVNKGFPPQQIIVYGRSIGSGVAVEVAANHHVRGLVLESAYSSLKKLANEKVPFFFPSLYLRYSFDNLAKINKVKCPVLFIHGGQDTLIPPTHTERLFDRFTGTKRLILIEAGAHNDLNSYPEFSLAIRETMPALF